MKLGKRDVARLRWLQQRRLPADTTFGGVNRECGCHVTEGNAGGGTGTIWARTLLNLSLNALDEPCPALMPPIQTLN